MATVSLRCRSVCEQDLDKVLNDKMTRLCALHFYAGYLIRAAPLSTATRQKSREIFTNKLSNRDREKFGLMSLRSKFVACEPQIALTQRRIISSVFHCKEVLHIRFPFPVTQGGFHQLARATTVSYQWSYLDRSLSTGVPLSRFERTLTSAIFDRVK